MNFCDLTLQEQLQLHTHDEPLNPGCFKVMGMDIPIKDYDISDALNCLLYYHKAESLRLLKEILERAI